jgi:hypothetical protein
MQKSLSVQGAGAEGDPSSVVISCDFGSSISGAHDLVSFLLRSDRDLSKLKGIQGDISVQVMYIVTDQSNFM